MIKSYKLITTKMCPKCPAMKEFMSSQDKLSGEVVDASTPDGMAVARKYVVQAVPTVIFVDENGDEVKRAQDESGVKEVLESL